MYSTMKECPQRRPPLKTAGKSMPMIMKAPRMMSNTIHFHEGSPAGK